MARQATGVTVADPAGTDRHSMADAVAISSGISFKAPRLVGVQVGPGIVLKDQSRKRLASTGTVHVPMSAEARGDVAIIRTGDCPDDRLEIGDQVNDAREGPKDPRAANRRDELTQAFELASPIAWAR